MTGFFAEFEKQRNEKGYTIKNLKDITSAKTIQRWRNKDALPKINPNLKACFKDDLIISWIFNGDDFRDLKEVRKLIQAYVYENGVDSNSVFYNIEYIQNLSKKRGALLYGDIFFKLKECGFDAKRLFIAALNDYEA